MLLSEQLLSEVKKTQLDILSIFIQVCDKLDLQYYLLHGTLLGAIRHKGFIPWDDDIDVGMPREDYEIFLRDGQSLLPSHLFIQTKKTEPCSLLWHAKIRDNNTTFIESSTKDFAINHGVFIDLFPLDYYPEDEKKQRRISFWRKWYTRRIGCELNLPEDQTFVRQLKKIVLKAVFPSIERVLSARELLYTNNSRSDIYVNYGGTVKEIMPVDWYGKGLKVQFEGIEAIAPIEYDKVLTKVYGDYMKLPPKEKRVGHHYTEVVDMSKSYTEYVGKY